MDKTAYRNHVAILEEELVCALGCTEPIAVAYAAALARAALGEVPGHLSVSCSGNIIKNVKSVTVPNSGGMRGIEAAATLGAVGGDETRALEVLEGVTDEHRAATRRLIENAYCSVDLAEGVPNLYVRAIATGGTHVAVACIEERHTNVTELTLDGDPVEVAGVRARAKSEEDGEDDSPHATISLESIWEFAHTLDVADVEEAISNQLKLNEAISLEGLTGNWGARIGKTLLATRPHDISCGARALAAAGSDARMSGCAMPVVINSGSGNQGITCSMPVLAYARELEKSEDELIRATVLSNLVSVHVKYFIGELSAFCGAVSAGAGAGAGICYLRGGSFAQFEATIVNTLANVGGIVCDGAKPSCAAKISAAVDAAILGCDMALSDDNFLSGEGLVGADAEETIRSMGYVGRVGMHPTDVEILNIMIGKTEV
ncbi:MAG: serine dehydratase subunit alpha family protein [Atopobiaceae bacterium]|nr:serine dehydratase subunit alpha family protein [Atopobiaceae bacterium]